MLVTLISADIVVSATYVGIAATIWAQDNGVNHSMYTVTECVIHTYICIHVTLIILGMITTAAENLVSKANFLLFMINILVKMTNILWVGMMFCQMKLQCITNLLKLLVEFMDNKTYQHSDIHL